MYYCILLYLSFFWICLRYLRWTLYKIDCVYFSGMAGAFFLESVSWSSWLPNWFCREPLIDGFSMILVFYFVVGSHFGFLRLLFCSEFGGTLLDGLVFCREPFSTKSPVSTLAWNEQGILLCRHAICAIRPYCRVQGKPHWAKLTRRLWAAAPTWQGSSTNRDVWRMPSLFTVRLSRRAREPSFKDVNVTLASGSGVIPYWTFVG